MGKNISIIVLLSMLLSSCMDSEEKIVLDNCKSIIKELCLNNSSNILTAYLMVVEIANSQSIVSYDIRPEVYQKGSKLIEYTNYYKVDGIYVFVVQKNKQLYTISKEMQEELYNWGNGGWLLETPSFVLTINRVDLVYNLESYW